MGSSLSAGTSNAKTFNQAARNVACIANLLWDFENQTMGFDAYQTLGFVVIAAEEKLADDKTFHSFVCREHVLKTIDGRIAQYESETPPPARGASRHADLRAWYTGCVEPLVNDPDRFRLECLSWESAIEALDPRGRAGLRSFYGTCKQYDPRLG